MRRGYDLPPHVIVLSIQQARPPDWYPIPSTSIVIARRYLRSARELEYDHSSGDYPAVLPVSSGGGRRRRGVYIGPLSAAGATVIDGQSGVFVMALLPDFIVY